jgi:hypothetical protein
LVASSTTWFSGKVPEQIEQLIIGKREGVMPVAIYTDLPPGEPPYVLSPLVNLPLDVRSRRRDRSGMREKRPLKVVDGRAQWGVVKAAAKSAVSAWPTQERSPTIFPSTVDAWDEVAGQGAVSLSGQPPTIFPGEHVEFHVPEGIRVGVINTNTPVFVWGSVSALRAEHCTSFTAFVNLVPDPTRHGERPAVSLRNVGSASVMLWGDVERVRCENVSELNLGLDDSGPRSSTFPPDFIRVVNGEFLQLNTNNCSVDVTGTSLVTLDVIARGVGRTRIGNSRICRVEAGPGQKLEILGETKEMLIVNGGASLRLGDHSAGELLLFAPETLHSDGFRVEEFAFVDLDRCTNASGVITGQPPLEDVPLVVLRDTGATDSPEFVNFHEQHVDDAAAARLPLEMERRWYKRNDDLRTTSPTIQAEARGDEPVRRHDNAETLDGESPTPPSKAHRKSRYGDGDLGGLPGF